MISLYSLGVLNLGLSNQNQGGNEVHQINLIVDYNNGTIKEKQNFTLSNGKTTAFDALNKWCDVSYVHYVNMGILVTAIDGISGNWVYSVNGTQPSVSSTKVYLTDNTTVKWWRISG
ncbi:MAG: DUF4430 domain-containing protein [Candidatus Lokiarchaeota archaeon]